MFSSWHGFRYRESSHEDRVLARKGARDRTGRDRECDEGMRMGHVTGSKEAWHHREDDRVQDQEIQHQEGGDRKRTNRQQQAAARKTTIKGEKK